MTLRHRHPRGLAAHVLLTVFTLFAAMLFAAAPSAPAQSYTSIVVFGDSLSDTGNDATLSNAKYTFAAQLPGPLTGYTNGRFTDGTDTVPSARNYTGVWIEQLAAKLTNKPAVAASLAGGTNYAYGFATTNTGTSLLTYGPSNALSITVNNLGQQVSDYFATHPTVNSSTLYVVWGGANDLLAATTTNDIVNAAQRELGLVQTLISAGATDILVPNLPPLGLIPRLNGSPATSAPATAAAQAFNQVVAAGLVQLAAANPGKTLHLFPLDVYTLFNTVVGPPIAPGFTNVTASSQGNSTINPDTYLFWDDLHPTTFGHSVIAASALRLLGTTVATTTLLSTSATSVNLGTAVTLTASVSSNSGTPIGTVTFTDGTTVLGSGLVSGSTNTGTYGITSTLAAGTHTIVATFTGVNGYGTSASSATTVTVIPSTFAASLSPTSLTISRGSFGNSILSLTPAGGYMGSFTVACGTVAKLSCSLSSSSLSISSTAPATALITLTTLNTVSSLHTPARGDAASRISYALLILPALAGLSLRRRRSLRGHSMGLLSILVVLSSGVMLLGLASCASSSDPLAHDTPSGTYTVPVTVTPASGTAVTLNISVTVQ